MILIQMLIKYKNHINLTFFQRKIHFWHKICKIKK